MQADSADQLTKRPTLVERFLPKWAGMAPLSAVTVTVAVSLSDSFVGKRSKPCLGGPGAQCSRLAV